MSGKFMRVKRFIIPTLTAVIIASQLMGCAAMTQSELLQAINNGDQIEIEVIEPGFVEDEQGQETALSWTELASLTTNADLRSGWDDTLGIIRTDEGKNGVFYVNEAGDNENNNTLKVVMHNRAFVQSLENEDSMKALAEASLKNYADIEDNETMKAVYMGINGYFNLLPDNEPNYANPDSTTTTDGTGTTASGDTYIPAHGNPGTPMSNEDTGKTNDHTQADMSWAIGATID